MVKNSPRPFSIVPPSLWNQAPTTSTGNSRVEFSPPTGSPPASCGVLVKEFHALKNYPQSVLDDEMTEPINTKEFVSKLSSQYNNVKVVSAVKSSLSGYVANLYNVQYSTGTPYGEMWVRGIMVNTMTTPGLSWVISCGAIGKNPDEAQKGYLYWQLEFNKFVTNLKIL